MSKRQAPERVVDVLSDEDLEALVRVMGDTPTGKRNRAATLLMGDSGLRVGEVTALELGDLVMQAGQLVRVVIRHGKGNKAAVQPVTQRTAVALGEWLAERERLVGEVSEVLLCSISRGQATGLGAGGALAPGRALSRAYLGQELVRAGEEAGLRMHVHPHLLRHTAITRYLRANRDLELTRRFARHADITTTARVYAHLATEDVEAGVRRMEKRGTASEE